jgi:hypothetical protein
MSVEHCYEHACIYGKVKANLSLCLTKLHIMKTYPQLNEAPHREDIWMSGGITPHVLNPDTRWR